MSALRHDYLEAPCRDPTASLAIARVSRRERARIDGFPSVHAAFGVALGITGPPCSRRWCDSRLVSAMRVVYRRVVTTMEDTMDEQEIEQAVTESTRVILADAAAARQRHGVSYPGGPAWERDWIARRLAERLVRGEIRKREDANAQS